MEEEYGLETLQNITITVYLRVLVDLMYKSNSILS